jgi:hypothetical protein
MWKIKYSIKIDLDALIKGGVLGTAARALYGAFGWSRQQRIFVLHVCSATNRSCKRRSEQRQFLSHVRGCYFLLYIISLST